MATGLNREQLLQLYRGMLRIRRFEENMLELFGQGKLPGFLHLYIGEEAVATGACAALRPTDVITSTHRGHGHIIAKGGDIRRMAAELFGKATGYCQGKGGSMHIVDYSLGILGANGIVGGGIPIATGAGLAAKMKGTDDVAVCFFGDGASNEGTFHESVNLATIWKLPVVYVCENNQYMEFTAGRELLATRDVSTRALGYGIPGVKVDGNDVLAVYEAVSEAVARARRGEGPSLVECLTYRHRGHAEGEEYFTPAYRPQEEINEWKARDPVPRFAQQLKQLNAADDAVLTQIRTEIDAAMQEAIQFAQTSPLPAVTTTLTDVYAAGGVQRG